MADCQSWLAGLKMVKACCEWLPRQSKFQKEQSWVLSEQPVLLLAKEICLGSENEALPSASPANYHPVSRFWSSTGAGHPGEGEGENSNDPLSDQQPGQQN